MKLKCTDCKGDVVFRRVAEPFSDNLPGIVVDGIERGVCSSCGATYRSVPRLRELQALLVGSVLGKAWRLAPEEVRWIRLSMGMRGEDLAKQLGITASQLSRWETGAAPISALADRLLRMVAASFHRLDAPALNIDGKRAEPLALRIEFVGKRWKALHSKAKTEAA